MGGPVSLVEVRGCGLCPGGTRVGVSRTNFTNSEVKGSFLPGADWDRVYLGQSCVAGASKQGGGCLWE